MPVQVPQIQKPDRPLGEALLPTALGALLYGSKMAAAASAQEQEREKYAQSQSALGQSGLEGLMNVPAERPTLIPSAENPPVPMANAIGTPNEIENPQQPNALEQLLGLQQAKQPAAAFAQGSAVRPPSEEEAYKAPSGLPITEYKPEMRTTVNAQGMPIQQKVDPFMGMPIPGQTPTQKYVPPRMIQGLNEQGGKYAQFVTPTPGAPIETATPGAQAAQARAVGAGRAAVKATGAWIENDTTGEDKWVSVMPGQKVPAGWKLTTASMISQKIDPRTADALADYAINSGQMFPGLGFSAATRIPIMNRMGEKFGEAGVGHPDLAVNALKFKGATAASNVLTRQDGMLNSFHQTVLKNMTLLDEQMDAVTRTPIREVNKWEMAVRNDTIGDPAVRQANITLYETMVDYGKVVSNNFSITGLTDTARAEAQKLLSMSDRPDAFKAELNTMYQTMANRLQSNRQAIKDTQQMIGGGAAPEIPGGNPAYTPPGAPQGGAFQPLPGETYEQYKARAAAAGAK